MDTTKSPRWCTELLSLVTARQRWRSLGTDLRPADVLISALGNSPHRPWHLDLLPARSGGLGADCTQTRHEAKLAHYGPHLPSLFRQNISYTPIVWSAYGRPHRDTLTVLRSLSKSTARKRNFVSAEVITPEIWKRSARQIRALNHSPCLGPWALSLL